MPGLAADEVQSSWSKNLHLPMPAAVRNRNERLIVAQPLGTAELRQRDGPATFHAWQGPNGAHQGRRLRLGNPLGSPAEVAFEMKPAVVGPLNVCTVAGCTRASVSRVLRGGAGVVLCASHVAEQCIGSSVKKAALSDWSAEGRCVGRWSPVTTDECWLLSSGHRACGTCAADIKDELLRVEGPAWQAMPPAALPPAHWASVVPSGHDGGAACADVPGFPSAPAAVDP